jgi:putative transposase
VKSDNQQCFHPWLLDLPTELREGAAFELAKNLKSAKTNHERGHINKYHLRFKSKKDTHFTLTNIQKRSYKKITNKCFMFLTSYLPFYFFSTENLPDEMEHDFSINYDGDNFYLLIPISVNSHDDIFDDRLAVSMDPGVRTFMTYFTEAGDYGKICCGDSVAKLYSLAIFVDRCLRRKAQKDFNKTDNGSIKKFKKRLQRLIDRTRKRMKNLQKEMHIKTSNWLTGNFKVILLPEFKVKEMSKRAKRKIHTKTVRNMSLLAHATFREMLKTKAKERGCQVILVSEHYTSKTCGGCGNLKQNLGSNKIYVCKKCNAILDRDVNGARNVMLRAMRGSAISEDEMNQIMKYRRELFDYTNFCRQ